MRIRLRSSHGIVGIILVGAVAVIALAAHDLRGQVTSPTIQGYCSLGSSTLCTAMFSHFPYVYWGEGCSFDGGADHTYSDDGVKKPFFTMEECLAPPVHWAYGGNTYPIACRAPADAELNGNVVNCVHNCFSANPRVMYPSCGGNSAYCMHQPSSVERSYFPYIGYGDFSATADCNGMCPQGSVTFPPCDATIGPHPVNGNGFQWWSVGDEDSANHKVVCAADVRKQLCGMSPSGQYYSFVPDNWPCENDNECYLGLPPPGTLGDYRDTRSFCRVPINSPFPEKPDLKLCLPSECGDTFCDPGETLVNCPSDCPDGGSSAATSAASTQSQSIASASAASTQSQSLASASAASAQSQSIASASGASAQSQSLASASGASAQSQSIASASAASTQSTQSLASASTASTKGGTRCDPRDCAKEATVCERAECRGDMCAKTQLSDGTPCASDEFTGRCENGICIPMRGAAPQCGNGVKEENEGCDGEDLGGETCQTLGYDGGPLACSPSCTFDVDLCRAYCCYEAKQFACVLTTVASCERNENSFYPSGEKCREACKEQPQGGGGGSASSEDNRQKKVFCCDVITKSTTPWVFPLMKYIPSLWRKLEEGPTCKASVFAQDEEQAKVFCDRLLGDGGDAGDGTAGEDEGDDWGEGDDWVGTSDGIGIEGGGGGGGSSSAGGGGNECCVAANGTVSALLPQPSTLTEKAWAAVKKAMKRVINLFTDIELNSQCGGGAVLTRGALCGGDDGGGNEWRWEEDECADGMDNDGDGDADCSDLACHISSGCGECYNDLLEQYYGTDDLEQREVILAQYPCDPKNSEFNECKESSLMTDAPSESENDDELSASLLAQGISLSQCSNSTRRGFACCSQRTDVRPSEREWYPRWKCTGSYWPLFHPYPTEAGYAAATCPTGTMQIFGLPPKIPLRDALIQCASSTCTTPVWCCDHSAGGWLATSAGEGASEPCKSSYMRNMYGSPRVIPPIADVIDGDLDSLLLPSDPASPPSLLGYEEKPDLYWQNAFGSPTPPAALCKKIEFCCDHPLGKWRQTAPGQTCAQLSSANPPLSSFPALAGYIGGDASLPVISASPYLQGNTCKKAVFCRNDHQRKCDVVFEDPIPPPCAERLRYPYSVDGLQRCLADFPPVCNNGTAERGEECGELGLMCPSNQICRDCRCLDPNCGNAVLEPGETCELGPDGFFPPCCVECKFAPQGVVCAPLPDGVDESCGQPGTCSGENAACPAPEISPDGTLCGDEEVPPTCIGGRCSALPYYWVLERTSVAGSVNEFCKRGDVCMNMQWEGGNQVCTWKKPPPFFPSSGLASTMPGERLSGMPPSGFASDPRNPTRPTCPPVVWSHTWSWNQSRKRYEPRRSRQRWVPEKCKPVSGFIYFLQSPQPTFQIRSAGSPAFATLNNDLVQWWFGPGCPLHPYLAKLVASSEACHQFAQFKYWLDYNLTPANKVNATQNSQAGQTPPRIYAALEAFQSHFNAIQTACSQLGTTAENANNNNLDLLVSKIRALKNKLSDFRTAFRGNNGLLNKLSSAAIYSPNNSATHPQFLSVKGVKNAWLNAMNFMKDPNTKLDQWITNTNI